MQSPNSAISMGPNFKLDTYSFVVDLEQDTSSSTARTFASRAAPRGLLVVQQQKQGEVVL